MKKYLIKKYILVSLIIICSIIFILNSDINISKINSNKFTVLIIVCSWVYALYNLIFPILKQSIFKKNLQIQESFYQPNPIDLQLRKTFFNLKINSSPNTLDISDGTELKVTFYRDKKVVKIWPKNEIKFIDIKSLVVKFDSYYDFFKATEYEQRDLNIYVARFYLLTNEDKLISLFYIDCALGMIVENYNKKLLHKRDDFHRFFTNYSKTISDLTNIKLIIYNK